MKAAVTHPPDTGKGGCSGLTCGMPRALRCARCNYPWHPKTVPPRPKRCPNCRMDWQHKGSSKRPRPHDWRPPQGRLYNPGAESRAGLAIVLGGVELAPLYEDVWNDVEEEEEEEDEV